MKVIIMTALTAMLMLSPRPALNAEVVGSFDTTVLPEYKGTLGNPECLIVHQNEKIIIVKIQDRYYYYRVK